MEDLIKDIKTLLSIDSKHSDSFIKTRIDTYVKEQIDKAPIHIKEGIYNTKVTVQDGVIVCEVNESGTQGNYSVTQGIDTYAMSPKDAQEIRTQSGYNYAISRNKTHGDI